MRNAFATALTELAGADELVLHGIRPDAIEMTGIPIRLQTEALYGVDQYDVVLM